MDAPRLECFRWLTPPVSSGQHKQAQELYDAFSTFAQKQTSMCSSHQQSGHNTASSILHSHTGRHGGADQFLCRMQRATVHSTPSSAGCRCNIARSLWLAGWLAGSGGARSASLGLCLSSRPPKMSPCQQQCSISTHSGLRRPRHANPGHQKS